MLKIKDINPNHYTRNWRISYRKNKWEKAIKEIEGDTNVKD